jgi:MOSC domain-containing protein YiiM
VAPATVASLQVGSIGELPYLDRTVKSAIRKRPVVGSRELTRFGLAGDEQADTVNHGGADKAVCAYPREHYPYWSRRLGRSLDAAAFGENLTVSGLNEDQARIGDVYALGSAIVQVSQPRQPCYKLAALYQQPKLALWVQESGYTGFYFRVVRPGAIEQGAELILAARPHPELTVTEANRVMHRDKHDLAAIERLLVPELAEGWRRNLRKRLDAASPEIED